MGTRSVSGTVRSSQSLRGLGMFFFSTLLLTSLTITPAPGQQAPGCRADSLPLWGAETLVARHSLTIGGPDLPDEYTFGRISDISVDGNSRIYVSDLLFARIQVYGVSGKYLSTMGRRGWGPGEFQALRSGVAFVDSGLVARDQRKGVFTLFASTGEVAASRRWDGLGLRIVLDRLLTDARGRFYETRRWYADTARTPYVLSYDRTHLDQPPDTIPLPPFHRPTIVVAGGVPGFSGLTYQPLTRDAYWTVLPDGRLVTVSDDSYSIEVRDRTELISCRIERSVPRMLISEQVRAREDSIARDRIDRHATTAGLSPQPFLRQLRIPKYYPYILGLWSDVLGRIWVQVPTGDSNAALEFDVHRPDGRFLGTIRVQDLFTGQSSIFVFGAEYIYVVALDTDGVETVRAYLLPYVARRR